MNAETPSTHYRAEAPASPQGEADPLPSDTSTRPPSWKERLRDPRWWRRELRSWLLMLVLIVVFSLALGALRAPDFPDQAPDFTLTTLEGETVRLSDFRGRTVVLNFWATWCPPCRFELPAFVRFARNNPDIVVLGLAVESPRPALETMIAEKGIGYPILPIDGPMPPGYRITSLPTTLVVGPDGKIEAAHSGIVLRPMLWWMTR